MPKRRFFADDAGISRKRHKRQPPAAKIVVEKTEPAVRPNEDGLRTHRIRRQVTLSQTRGQALHNLLSGPDSQQACKHVMEAIYLSQAKVMTVYNNGSGSRLPKMTAVCFERFDDSDKSLWEVDCHNIHTYLLRALAFHGFEDVEIDIRRPTFLETATYKGKNHKPYYLI